MDGQDTQDGPDLGPHPVHPVNQCTPGSKPGVHKSARGERPSPSDAVGLATDPAARVVPAEERVVNEGSAGSSDGETAGADEIGVLMKDLFGVRAIHVQRMHAGLFNITFEVALPGRTLIVRTNNSADAFRGTERNLAVLRDLGLPVPRVVGSNLTCSRYPWAYLILEKMPGRDLRYELDEMTRPQMTALAEQVVSFQRVVARLPEGHGFGWVSIDEVGPYQSWTDLVEDKLAKHLHSLGSRIAPDLRESADRHLQRLGPYFAGVNANPFLDDITTKNVIVQNGRLQGIIDFDCIGYGDPLLWLGLTQMAVLSGQSRKARHYVCELRRLYGVVPAQRPALAFYTGLFAIDFACEALRAGDSHRVQRLLDLARWLLNPEGSASAWWRVRTLPNLV